MGFLNPNADLEIAIQTSEWKEFKTLFSDIAIFISDSITYSIKCKSFEDTSISQKLAKNQLMEIEKFQSRAEEINSRTKSIISNLDQGLHGKTKKSFKILLRYLACGHSVLGLQNIFLMYIHSQNYKNIDFYAKKLLKDSNIMVYNILDKLILTGQSPKWSNFIFVQPGRDPVELVTLDANITTREIENLLLAELSN